MRKFNRYLETSIIIALISLGSCSTISMDSIQSVKQGMSTNDLSLMLGNPYAYKMFSFVDTEDGLEYQVRIYFMVTGEQTTYTPGYYVGGVYIPEVHGKFYFEEEFAFLFVEDSLLFWGFLHEFARSDDERIRRLAPIIIERSKKAHGKEYILEID